MTQLIKAFMGWHNYTNPLWVITRVHNTRGRGEYPTLLVWENALRKMMT